MRPVSPAQSGTGSGRVSAKDGNVQVVLRMRTGLIVGICPCPGWALAGDGMPELRYWIEETRRGSHSGHFVNPFLTVVQPPAAARRPSAGYDPEALVILGRHLVYEIYLPGEVLAHRFLSPLAAFARRA